MNKEKSMNFILNTFSKVLKDKKIFDFDNNMCILHIIVYFVYKSNRLN